MVRLDEQPRRCSYVSSRKPLADRRLPQASLLPCLKSIYRLRKCMSRWSAATNVFSSTSCRKRGPYQCCCCSPEATRDVLSGGGRSSTACVVLLRDRHLRCWSAVGEWFPLVLLVPASFAHPVIVVVTATYLSWNVGGTTDCSMLTHE